MGMSTSAKIKIYILIAFALGMIQIAILDYIATKWVAPYFVFALLIDIILLFILFNFTDKIK